MRTFKHVDSNGVQATHLSEQDVLAAMDRAGVERGILATKVYYAAQAEAVAALNEDFAIMSDAGAGRFKWIASIAPPELGASTYWDVMQNTRIIDQFHNHQGLCGVHLTPSPWGILPNDKWFYPVYTKCVEYGLPVFTYVGAPGPLWPMNPNNPEHLDDVALAFPDLKIIAHHIGDPWTEMAVRLAVRHDNFFICTSAWSPKAYPANLLSFLGGKWHGVWGCEKVLFASDFPLLDLERTVRDARELGLEPPQLENFLFRNATNLFWH
jgi:predicted TIM-barrel fold metal-dependent hydrolase